MNTDPYYPDTPEKCFVVLQGAPVGVGVVQRGYQGYGLVFDYTRQVASLGYDKVVQCAREVVDRYNEALGVTKGQEMACSIGSLSGWHVPGANPAHWTPEGKFKR